MSWSNTILVENSYTLTSSCRNFLAITFIDIKSKWNEMPDCMYYSMITQIALLLLMLLSNLLHDPLIFALASSLVLPVIDVIISSFDIQPLLGIEYLIHT